MYQIDLETLIKRVWDSKDSINEFFEAPLSNLHNPFLMKDMDKAVKRLIAAVEKKKK